MRRTREDTCGTPSVLPIHQHKIGIVPFDALCSICTKNQKILFMHSFVTSKNVKWCLLILGHLV